MGPFDDVGQGVNRPAVGIDIGILLDSSGRVNTRMAEHFASAADVSSSSNQFGGEGMAESTGRQPAGDSGATLGSGEGALDTQQGAAIVGDDPSVMIV